MAEGGMRVAKCLIFTFNIICFLSGLALIIVGALAHVQLDTYANFFGASLPAVSIVLIVIGVLMFVIGFFGCCGAYKEQYCMVMTFAVLLGVILVCEVAVAIAAFVMRDWIKDRAYTEIDQAAVKYNTTGHDTITATWDVMQHDLKCCGVSNYTTWSRLAPNVPDSCCREETVGCGHGNYNSYDERFFSQGCATALEDNMEENVLIIGVVGIALAIIQIIGISLACCLARSINRGYRIV